MAAVFKPEATGADESAREKTIVRTSIIGIIANVFLAGFKAVVGMITNSIAIVLDAHLDLIPNEK